MLKSKPVFYFSLLVFISMHLNFQAQTRVKDSIKAFSIGEIRTIKSLVLNEERTLNIYLPSDYNVKDSIRYHVIYLLDGSADEDFIHVAGLVQFCTFPWIEQLPKTIVVGVASVDRRRDFTFPSTIASDIAKNKTSGKSKLFIDFIEQELQPYIRKNFKTDGNNTIIGQSLGGLLATEILFKKPSLFNKYIIISPSLWWDNGSLLNFKPEILNESYQLKTDIYIGVGKEGLAPCDSPHVMEVEANLLNEKIQQSKNKKTSVHFDYLPEENHATIAHQAIFNALKRLFKKV